MRTHIFIILRIRIGIRLPTLVITKRQQGSAISLSDLKTTTENTYAKKTDLSSYALASTLNNYYTKAQVNSLIASLGGSSGGSSTPTSTKLWTSAGSVDTSGIIHLTGKQVSEQFPHSGIGSDGGYQWLIWSGSYTASNRPTPYSTFTSGEWTTENKQRGLMGRLEYGVTNNTDTFTSVRWFNASNKDQFIGDDTDLGNHAVRNSDFTLAPLSQ